MIHLRSLGCYAVPVLGVLVLVNVVQASVLNDLILDDVAATYTYQPNQDMLGVLELNDTNVGFVAILKDGPPIEGTTDVFLSIELTAELGDPNDNLARGLFGPGLLTMSQGKSDGDPPVTLFEANLDDGFDLFEIGKNSGSHQGVGTFSNAVYGADFDGVTSPTSGDFFVLIFTWYSDEAKTQPVNIRNYTDSMDPGTIIYADVTVNIVPEPTSLVPLATMALWWLRRRRAA